MEEFLKLRNICKYLRCIIKSVQHPYFLKYTTTITELFPRALLRNNLYDPQVDYQLLIYLLENNFCLSHMPEMFLPGRYEYYRQLYWIDTNMLSLFYCHHCRISKRYHHRKNKLIVLVESSHLLIR